MTQFTPFLDHSSGLEIIGQYISHGEVNIIPIRTIPDALGAAVPLENNMHILGHSESGAHHVLDRVDNIERHIDPSSPDIGAPSSCPVRSFLKVIGDDVKLEHLGRGNHGSQSIPAGNYLVTTNVQYTPQGLQRDAD